MEKKYSKEFLINEFWRFYNEFRRYPLLKDFKDKNNNYPSPTAYKNYWSSWYDLLNELELLGEDKWYKCDENILNEMYKTEPQDNIISKLMVKRSWSTISHKANKMGLKRSKVTLRKFTDEFLIEELKRYYLEFGRTPLYNDFESNEDYPSSANYKKRFGSWNKALELAGLELNNITEYTKDGIMNDIVEFYNKNDRSPYYYELKYSRGTLNKFWNSFEEALKECGTPLNRKENILKSKEEGIKFLQNVTTELGRIPTATEVDNEFGVFRGWFTEKFGSWNQALFEAGLIERVLTKDEWIELSISGLISLSQLLDKCPTVNEYEDFANKEGLINRRGLEQALNESYNDICMKYLGRANNYQKNKKEIYEQLLRIKETLGRTPKSSEISQFGLGFHVCAKVFGMRYNEMILSFGWELSGHLSLIKTKEEMLEDYLNLYKRINRLPLMNDIDSQKDMCSFNTYKIKFGNLVNVWKELNLNYKEELSKGKYGYLCVDNNGELCKSYHEMIITNILIRNNILYIKELPYVDLIPEYDSKKRFDWYLPDYDIAIEFFGLFHKKNINNQDRFGQYARRTIKKIKMCEDNNVKLISIYLDDTKNNYNGLVEKLNEFGINIIVDEEVLNKVV